MQSRPRDCENRRWRSKQVGIAPRPPHVCTVQKASPDLRCLQCGMVGSRGLKHGGGQNRGAPPLPEAHRVDGRVGKAGVRADRLGRAQHRRSKPTWRKAAWVSLL